MKLGLVVGNVVSTTKVGRLDGRKLLLVRHLNELFTPSDGTVVCVDTVGAGAGDVVLVCASSSARMMALTKDTTVDAAIVGVVDVQASEVLSFAPRRSEA